MTKEQLLKPRWKVIADYPGALHNVGYIIQAYENGVAYLVEGDSYSMNDFPALFKRLKWHEDRELSDMPEYVKSTLNNDHVYKVKFFKEDCCITKSPSGRKLSCIFLLPATVEEYDYFIQKNK